MTIAGSTSLLAVTDEAIQKILGFREQAPTPERQAMWIEITGISGGEWTYNLSLRPADEAEPDDAVETHGELTIVVPEPDVEKLRGVTVEWSGDPFAGGLRLAGLASPSPAVGGGAPADLSGDVAQQVLQVLEQQVNPAIAAHGGRADLVAVEEGAAYLRLSGGCQGCGMATVTLGQGIEVQIKENVPEIHQVVDVTDHASGTNPYFESAKK
ncbi:MAG: NifU family protein [Thermoleophilaceae bacterium]|nr:NifU family protein [Thermoleophilaceae bacterium]